MDHAACIDNGSPDKCTKRVETLGSTYSRAMTLTEVLHSGGHLAVNSNETDSRRSMMGQKVVRVI